MSKYAIYLEALVLFMLIAFSGLCSAKQISPQELRDPDIYAVCFWGSCFSPLHGKAFCFDDQISPRPEDVDVEAPYNSLLLRGRLISKTNHSAIFMMYQTYAMSWGFFGFFDNEECEEAFCSFEELQLKDPGVRDIWAGDRVCVIPLATYQNGNSAAATVRAIEVQDVSRNNLLDCSRSGGHANIRNRHSWL